VITIGELYWMTGIVGGLCGAILLAAAIMANHP
jgi:hypothetical protein